MIVARIQAHPDRADLHPTLLADLAAFRPELVVHSSDPPSPWAGYKLCLTGIPECDHLLVIQDDTALAPNFRPALERIAESNPDTPVCLFLSEQPAEVVKQALYAYKRRERYIELSRRLGWRRFVPVVAILWPRHKAVEFKAWADAHPTLPGQRNPRSDDAFIGWWKQRTDQKIRIAVPSIVEHLGVPSVKGSKNVEHWKAKILAQDALSYDW